MSTKHTPEPWEIREPELQMNMVFIHAAKQGFQITSFLNLERGRADAQRVVSCVNAMAGIPDPAAFMEVVRHLELDAYKKVKEQRDKLLQAIKDLLDADHYDHFVVRMSESEMRAISRMEELRLEMFELPKEEGGVA
jgi:ribosomal protein S13